MGQQIFQIGIVFIVCVCFGMGPAPSATASETLSFKEALGLAFDRNPQMVEARRAVDSARGDLLTARALQNPQAQLEFGGLKKDGDGKRNAGLEAIEVQQPFDPVGVRFFKSKIASNQVASERQALRLAWASVYRKLRETYAGIILDQKRLELAGDNLNAMRQFFGRVQQRYQSGQAFKNDLQRARIELLKAEHAYLSAEKELMTDRARLNLILGRPMETGFEIIEKLKEDRLQSSMEQLKAIARANRPDIKMAELALDSNNKNHIKEKLNRLPSYAVGFKRTDTDDEDDYAIVVGVSIPLWNLNQGEVEKARAQKEAQIVRTRAVKDEAMFDVYASYLDAELAQRQFELSKKSLEEANELLRLANLRYSEGKIDFLNYLDQIKTAAQAKVNYYEGLFELSRSMTSLEASIYASLREEDFFNEKL